VLLALISPRPIVKPLLTLLLIATAVAVHFMNAYGVILDTSMLRNLLHTDVDEARELVSRDVIVAVLAYAAVPIGLVWWSQLIRSSPRRALARRVLATWNTRARTVLFVVIVGETVRADHLALNGYARDTTPELMQLGVVNFPDVTSCGTATEVSLPCMFSALGRGHYDSDRIRREEGLLNVLARAGLHVVWRDNQSGCKGVCDGKGIEFQSVKRLEVPDLCGPDGLDEILLRDLETTVASDGRSQVIVMHQLGNHGPAYFSRYPQRFRRFVPTCDTAELRHCTRRRSSTPTTMRLPTRTT